MPQAPEVVVGFKPVYEIMVGTRYQFELDRGDADSYRGARNSGR
jgi:hypothetical protein